MAAPTPLKRAIFESQRTQREIAAQIGMDEGHLSRIVNGLRCGVTQQSAIAAALGCSVAELWPASESEAA